MDDYGLSRQVMADMEKVYDDLIIIKLCITIFIGDKLCTNNSNIFFCRGDPHVL